MNRIYKVIWSRVKKCYVVVSEFANNRGKISGSGGTSACTVLCALALVGSIALPLNTVHAVIPEGTGSGISLGNGTETGSDPNNVAIGGYAKSLGAVALAIGAHSNSSAQYSTALGGGSNATAQNATAIGGVAYASAKNAVAVGANAKASGEYAAAIGGDAKADKTHAIAIGSVAHAQEESSLAMGSLAKATNTYAYAIGGNAQAKGRWSIAMGTNAVAEDDASVAIGTWSNATSGQSAAVGYQAKAKALGATALGRLTNVTAVDGTAIGSSTSVTGLNGTSIGNKANVTVKNGVAIGNEANAKNENAVAIGSGSETATAVGTTSETVNGEIHNFAGINPTSTVSVGKTGVERTITNVAAGRLSATSTDAINGSQLYAVNTEVNKGVVYAGDVKAAGATDNKFIQRLGAQTNVVGGVTDVSKLSDNNIGVVSDGINTLNVKLAKELNNLTSVTTGNTVMNTDGVTITGGPKIVKDGINAGNKQITGVASGGDVITNGANIGDINRIVDAKDKYVTGGTATYQANGDGIANLTGTNGLTANVTGLKNNFVTSGSVSNDGKTLTLERNDTGKVNVDLSNVFTEVGKGDYRLVANPDLNSQGKYKVDSDGNMVLTVANDKGDKKQVTLTDIASKVQQDTNTTNITNINTTIAKGLNFAGDTGTDINKQLGDKLSIKGGASADLTDNNIGVESDGTQLNVKLKKDINLGPDGSLAINGKTYVNKDGLNAGGQKITNVVAGTAGTDAVNVDQLNAAIGGTAKATTVKAKDANVTVTEGVNAAGGKEYTVGLGDKVTLGSDADKQVVVDGTTGTITAGNKVTIHGTTGDIKAGIVKITGAGTVNELTNRIWDIDNPTVVHGQAATEDQLKYVSDGVKNNKNDITNINKTIVKGLNFKGDDTTVINKQLGEQLDIKGGADTNKLSDDNIGVVSANGALNVKLAKELKNLTSVTTGDTVMNTDGLTINGGPKILKNGIDAGNKKITNVAAGTDNTDAVNVGQLKDAIAAGKTILKDGKNTTVEGDGSAANPYKVNVNDDLVLGKKGTDGKDGSIGVNGKDGSAVVINGKDGSIGLNGKDGNNAISIKGGEGKSGIDGKNITRLVIEEKNGDKHDVATLDDGMKYGGDTGAVIKKKLNEQVNVVGGITDVSKLTTDDNIGVISDGDSNLKVRLAKDLKGLNSVTTGDTVMNTDGLTINGGPKIVKTGIDAGGKKITNVADGTDVTDAVNVSQLSKAVAGATTKLENGKNTTVTSTTNNDGSKTYKVNLNDDITLGTDPNKQISIKGSEGTIQAGKVTVNGTGGTVNNLTNKAWDPANITSGQAATEDQLKAVASGAGKYSSVSEGNNISVIKGTNAIGGVDYKVSVIDAPTFKSVTTGNTVMNNSGLTIKNGPSITETGINAGNKKITNVAAGTSDTDAVNVSQLKEIGGNIKNIDGRMNRVGAGAAALAALHPLDFDPDDKWDIAAGYGNYKDAHAASIGAFYRPNEDTLFSVGGSFGGGENMLNAGVSMKIGQGNHVSTSRVAMAKEIKDLRAELENVKGILMKVSEGKQLNSLDLDKMQLFPDIPENHWAYDYVATLAGNGIIVGYPDGKFGGDRMMTRYEMAALIYRAIQNGAVADDQMVRALKEFQPELERIRVDTISKHKDGTPDIQRVRVIKGRG
ncbi:ESPR-type extended signal peptide-containing protein [Veillonella parvula]|uniref:ESPR-type extended signal peptide-containing protein n=1 Tax=Veillonella parvula TaxID=29466 RepID=UPI003AB49337